MNFSDRIAVVSGGTGALGRILVQQLLDAGARVGIPFRGTGQPAEMPDWSGAEGRVFLQECDVSDAARVDTFIAAVTLRWQRIDFLVHAAGGFAGGKRLEEVDPADWNSVLAMNLNSGFLLAHAALPVMRAQGFGRIIFIGAASALSPQPLQVAYAVSKRGLVTVSEVLAQEVAGSGITVNVIAPTIIRTPANLASMPDADHAKWVLPQDIGAAVLHLCSPEGRSVNGAVLRMPGGLR